MRILPIILLLPFLSACASLTQEQCVAGNWAQIGFNDGVNGRSADYITRHFDACSKVGISPDPAAWNTGRAQGLPQYCTVDNAYERGRDGRNFNQVCPINQRNTLNRAHDWGLEYYEIDKEIDKLESDKRAAQIDISALLALPAPTADELALLARLRSEIRSIDRDIRRLTRELRRYDRSPF